MPTPTQQGELFTPQELARFLGMSEASIFLWRQKGQGPRLVQDAERSCPVLAHFS